MRSRMPWRVRPLANHAKLFGAPDNVDARALRSGLELIFEDVDYDADTATLCFGSPRTRPAVTVRPQLAAQSRSLFCLYPALLARARDVTVAAPPSGCQIGARPSDWYINVLRPSVWR